MSHEHVIVRAVPRKGVALGTFDLSAASRNLALEGVE